MEEAALVPRTSVKALAEKYDCFCLDCDGVLWSGSQPIDQAFEVINWLVEQGKQVFFITNSSGKTRADYQQRIAKLGFAGCTEAMIYGSAYTTARFIKERYPEI